MGGGGSKKKAAPPPPPPKTGGYKPTKIDMSEIMGGSAKPATTEVPAGYPPAPKKPPAVFEDKNNEDAYKEWMRNKIRYETWENSLVAYSMRLKEGNNAAAQQIVARLKADGY